MNLRERVKLERTKWDGSMLWSEMFKRFGYVPIILGSNYHSGWNSIHEWCIEEIGVDHYTWTGSTFWFEYEKDATLFALRWV
jgi:hypothetical protein